MPSTLSKRCTVFQVTPDRSARSAADIPSKALAARIWLEETIDRSDLEYYFMTYGFRYFSLSSFAGLGKPA